MACMTRCSPARIAKQHTVEREPSSSSGGNPASRLNGQARLTAATALAIERLDWGDAEYRMRPQVSYDLAQERRKRAA